MLRKILVPIDGSGFSAKAVDFAVDLAKKYGAKVVLLHVIEHIQVPKDFQALTESEKIRDTTRQYLRRLAEHVTRRAEGKLKASGLSYEVVIDEGAVVDRIVNQAISQKVDLIVVGTRGLGAVKRVLLGSVSQGVSAHAPCTVAIVK